MIKKYQPFKLSYGMTAGCQYHVGRNQSNTHKKLTCNNMTYFWRGATRQNIAIFFQKEHTERYESIKSTHSVDFSIFDQAIALVDIVKSFNWTYISTICSEGSYGNIFLQKDLFRFFYSCTHLFLSKNYTLFVTSGKPGQRPERHLYSN